MCSVLSFFNGDGGGDLRNIYIKVWEELNNPDFNYGEFAIIENQSSLNGFKVRVKELVNKF